MICDKCLHADVCREEGSFEEALTYCADFLGWIPVSERLPMNGDACCDDDVLVSCEDGSVKIGFCMGYDELGNREWCISADKYAEVAAWMPLPESYRGDKDGKNNTDND